MGTELLRGHGWPRVSRNDQTIHYGVSGHIARYGGVAFIPPAFSGRGLPLFSLKCLSIHLTSTGPARGNDTSRRELASVV